jgi:hypothetical protein
VSQEKGHLYPAVISVKQAMNDEQWRRAMDEELDSHRENQTWTVVPAAARPDGVHLVGCKWVFAIKHDGRKKARLVLRGDQQLPGEFDETYADVADFTTIRILFAIAAILNLKIATADFKTAYLNSQIDVVLHMKPPAGLICPKGSILRVNRGIYGLRQAGRLWRKALHEALIAFGMEQCKNDPCLYLWRKDDSIALYCATWVDDLLILSIDDETQSAFTSALQAKFKLNVDTNPTRYLGIQIDQQPNHIRLHQTEYIDKAIKHFGLQHATEKNTPWVETPTRRMEEEPPADTHVYRTIIGSLMWVSKSTRPDIQSVTIQLAAHQENPSQRHLDMARRVWRYLKHTKTMGLTYFKTTKSAKSGPPPSLVLEGWCDANFATCVDTRRSTTGYVYQLNGTSIVWCSRTQEDVSLCTAESECAALSDAVKDALYLRNFLEELSFPQRDATRIHEDNQSAIAVAHNQHYRGKIKHMAVRIHFLRQAIERSQITLSYCDTTHQVADPLTKPLPAPRFNALRERLGVT